MNIQNVFNRFCLDLQNRRGIMTEDNIRYYWFAAMLREDDDLNHYTLEFPYKQLTLSTKDNLEKEELDLLYDNKSTDFFCFEMKFHRNNTEQTFAKTSAAGSIFNDLQRLQQIANPSARRLFLYVTDSVMNEYLLLSKRQNKNDDYDKLLNIFYATNDPADRDLSSTITEPTTFIDRANKSLNPNAIAGGQNFHTLKIRLLHHNYINYTKEFEICSFKDRVCHVRLYEIL